MRKIVRIKVVLILLGWVASAWAAGDPSLRSLSFWSNGMQILNYQGEISLKHADGTTEHELDKIRVAAARANSRGHYQTRLIRSSFPGASFSFNEAAIEDYLKGISVFEYDNFGNVLSIKDPRGLETRFNYNSNKKLTAVHKKNERTETLSYNRKGLLSNKSYGNARELKYKYNKNDQLTKVRSIKWNGEKDVTSLRYKGCSGIIGQVCEVENSVSKVAYQYNEKGDLIFQKTNLKDNEISIATRFKYADNGELRELVYPNDLKVFYSYDKRDSIEKVYAEIDGSTFNIIDKVEYNGDIGWNAKVHFGNGLITAFSHLEDGSLTSIITSDKFGFYYSYNPSGTIATISRVFAPELSRSFEYDSLGRLVGEATSRYYSLFNYDESGNRLLHQSFGEKGTLLGEKKFEYSSSSNRIISVNGEEFEYDSLGNIIGYRDGDMSFDYDSNNRLKTVFQNGRMLANYRYNAFGRRIYKRVSHEEANGNEEYFTTYSYSPGGQLLSESDWSHDQRLVVSRNYIWVQDFPIAQIVTSYDKLGNEEYHEIFYLHTDSLRTPRFATDLQGSVVWKWESDGFGIGLPETDVDGDGEHVSISLRFSGQVFDKESGLHYNLSRFYDPLIGRYLQPDPAGVALRFDDPLIMSAIESGFRINEGLIVEGGSPINSPYSISVNHLYVYAHNNPVIYTDSYGLAVLTCEQKLLQCRVKCRKNPIVFGACITECEAKFGATSTCSNNNQCY